MIGHRWLYLSLHKGDHRLGDVDGMETSGGKGSQETESHSIVKDERGGWGEGGDEGGGLGCNGPAGVSDTGLRISQHTFMVWFLGKAQKDQTR